MHEKKSFLSEHILRLILIRFKRSIGTMSGIAISTNPGNDIQREKAPNSDVGKERDMLSPEDGEGSKKGHGLLQVPSRSSSQQRNQSSPTSTGLSGATVTDPRNSISGRSKDSKGSFLDRQRNGSASSHRTGGDSDPTRTPGISQPSSPSTSEQKKKKKRSGGLLALLGCCGVPDSAKTVEGDTENVHKLTQLPPRPTTAKSRTHTPQDQTPTKQQNEKNSNHTSLISEPKDKRISSNSTQEQPPVAESSTEGAKQSAPAVTVNPPSPPAESSEAPRDEEVVDNGDIIMQDAASDESREAHHAPVNDEPQARTIPPPPPGPGPMAVTPLLQTEPGPSAPEPQKWLLPPVAPEHAGRKCLVLDLDETLVHSSFKVCILFTPIDLNFANQFARFSTKPISPYPSRSRVIIIMFTSLKDPAWMSS